MKDLLQGALLIVEACAAAGALAAVNAAKTNTDRGTFAIMPQKDANGVPTGKGGIDLDVGLGALLVLGAAVAPASIAPHLAALGTGGLACFAAREGAQYGAKQAAQATQMGGSVQGMPYSSLSGYQPHYGQAFPAAPFVAGFANAQPIYAGVR